MIRRWLPIYEAIRYSQSHQELLQPESDEKRDRLEEKAVSIEPTNAARARFLSISVSHCYNWGNF
ncbi:MAG TPA: hypothetical protein DCY88_29630 [Cyanobacteria bacterium UBA11372]|nr:hypothetical protein [Cyanobacteria bacterium UBA11372]